MQVRMEVQTVIAANTRNANIFADQQYQTAPFSGTATLLVTGSAAGLEVGMYVAGDLVSEEAPINANNRSPIVPDDALIMDVNVMEGEPLAIPVRNTTAGPLTVFARLIYETP